MKRRRLAGLLGLALALGLWGSAAADVVAVVSATSRVSSLSKAQVADIFLGKIGRFPDGSLAMPIDRPEGSAARDEFYSSYAGKSPAQVRSHWAKIIFTGRGQPPKAVAADTDLIKLIAANPTAIGYVERSAVNGSVRVLTAP